MTTDNRYSIALYQQTKKTHQHQFTSKKGVLTKVTTDVCSRFTQWTDARGGNVPSNILYQIILYALCFWVLEYIQQLNMKINKQHRKDFTSHLAIKSCLWCCDWFIKQCGRPLLYKTIHLYDPILNNKIKGRVAKYCKTEYLRMC